MIRLWISSRSSATIRQQLSAQLLLGILSGRLAPGERLPSTRALAQRLHVHANTISAVYQDLSARGWVETRRGSGVFVRCREPGGSELTAFVSQWLKEAERRGFTAEELEAELRRRSACPIRTDHLLVVDPDAELARLIADEISASLAKPVTWADTSSVVESLRQDSRVFVNAGHAAQVAPILGSHPFETVRLKSMQDVIAGQTRPVVPVLIGFVSFSATVRDWASTLLCALGFPLDSVLLRDPNVAGWKDGLGACHILAADVCAARELPTDRTPIVFRVVDEDWLSSLDCL